MMLIASIPVSTNEKDITDMFASYLHIYLENDNEDRLRKDITTKKKTISNLTIVNFLYICCSITTTFAYIIYISLS